MYFKQLQKLHKGKVILVMEVHAEKQFGEELVMLSSGDEDLLEFGADTPIPENLRPLPKGWHEELRLEKIAELKKQLAELEGK